MTILDEIIAHKKEEIRNTNRTEAIKRFESSEYFEQECISFSHSIIASNKSGIIAEFKRQSPSKGVINDRLNPVEVAKAYQNSKASALSILTNTKYFGGKPEDVIVARPAVTIPILRKEFIVDELQIIEAKALGADAILLIAEALSKSEIKELAECAQTLGLEVLMEVNSIEELDKASHKLNAIGVNNRDLRTFIVDIKKSLEIYPHIPNEFLKISESGLSIPENVITLKEAGFDGFLMGEAFMKTSDPGQACATFAKQAKLV